MVKRNGIIYNIYFLELRIVPRSATPADLNAGPRYFRVSA